MDKEKEFLEWFYAKCDFGPAHGDVIHVFCEAYEEETGNKVPEEYAPYGFHNNEK